MAIAAKGSISFGFNASSGTSYTYSLTTTSCDANEFLILINVTDNSTTTDGSNNEHTSITGGTGVWTKLGEYTNGEGVAGDGATVSAWLFEASGSNAVGTVFTLNFASAIVDKACNGWVFTKASGYHIEKETGTTNPVTNVTDASNGFGSVSFSGLASIERLYVRGLGKEVNIATNITASTNFSAFTAGRSRNNAAAVIVRGEYRINTSTGETSNPTLAVSGDTAGLFLALKEVVNGGAVNDVMTADAGAYTLTGIADAAIIKLLMESGTLSLTGISAGVNSLSHSATAGAYTLTGVSAGINTLLFTASVGAYTLTGIAAVNSIRLAAYEPNPSATNEKQVFTISNTGTPATNFNITASGYGTQGCSYHTTEAALTGALGNGLNTLFGSGNTSLTYLGLSGSDHSWRIEWISGLANTNIPLMTFAADTSGATGGFTADTDATPANIVGSYSVTGVAAFFLNVQFLVADAGAYTLTGVSILFTPVVLLVCDAGTYSLTGIASTLRVASRTTFDAGAYTLTGVAAAFGVTQTLIAAQGSYALTGIAATLHATIRTPASAGAYALAGVSAGLFNRAATVVDAGAYTLTGVAADMTKRGHVCASGAYVLTGFAAALRYETSTSAIAGVYTLTGKSVALFGSHVTVASQGVYALTGIAAAGRITVSAAHGVYAITGEDAELNYDSPIIASAGSYTYTGNAATLRTAGNTLCDTGGYTLGGIAVLFHIGRTIIAEPGAYTLSGQSTILQYQYHVVAAAGDYSLTGIATHTHVYARASAGAYALAGVAAIFRNVDVLAAAFGTYVLTGNAVPFRVPLPASAGAYAVSGQAMSARIRVNAVYGQYTYSGSNTGLEYSTNIIADAGAYTLSGVAAAWRSRVYVHAGAGAYAYAGVSVGFRYVITLVASPGAYVVTGYAATLTFAGVQCSTLGEVQILPTYICAIDIAAAYIGSVGLESAYSATVSINGVEHVTMGETPFFIGEPNDIWIYDFKRRSTGLPQAAETPYFNVVNVATNTIVTGLSNIALVCVDAVEGTYLGTSPAIAEIADAAASNVGLQKDSSYRVDIYSDGKLKRQIYVTATIRGMI